VRCTMKDKVLSPSPISRIRFACLDWYDELDTWGYGISSDWLARHHVDAKLNHEAASVGTCSSTGIEDIRYEAHDLFR